MVEQEATQDRSLWGSDLGGAKPRLGLERRYIAGQAPIARTRERECLLLTRQIPRLRVGAGVEARPSRSRVRAIRSGMPVGYSTSRIWQ